MIAREQSYYISIWCNTALSKLYEAKGKSRARWFSLVKVYDHCKDSCSSGALVTSRIVLQPVVGSFEDDNDNRCLGSCAVRDCDKWGRMVDWDCSGGTTVRPYGQKENERVTDWGLWWSRSRSSSSSNRCSSSSSTNHSKKGLGGTTSTNACVSNCLRCTPTPSFDD